MKRQYRIVFLIIAVLVIVPSMRVTAQTFDMSNSSDLSAIVAIGLVLLLLLALPVTYLMFKQSNRPKHSLLLVSTDEAVFPLVKNAARRTSYNAITVYRYEDALEKLRYNTALTMIIVDDSVPQYETGLLLS